VAAQARIFILDDDELVVAMLVRALRGEGYDVQSSHDPAGVIETIQAFAPDLVLLDMKLPGATGIEILERLNERLRGVQVVMLSSDASAESAVRAMKLGAVDYLTKPFELEEVKLVLASLLEKAGLQREVEYLRKVSVGELARRDLIGASSAVTALREGAGKLARAGVNMVLITGENGTGKEQVARYIHQLMHPGGPGRVAPFIGINCAAIPETLMESELFGHDRGAFTDARADKKGAFELASGGTILLDELGELRWDLQAKLLRVLEERTFRRVGGHVDVPLGATVFATTNRDLEDAIRDGQFRVDLFYRLATFSLHIVPLRERTDDLLPLARHFLGFFAAKYGRPPVTGFSGDAERLLLAYRWPGNVRELRNVMERLVVLGGGEEVQAEHLPKEILRLRPEPAAARLASPERIVLPEGGLSLDALERDLIEQALERAGGNKAIAAKLLGVSYDSIRYQVKKLGLSGSPMQGLPRLVPPDDVRDLPPRERV